MIDIVRIGSVELTKEDAERYYRENRCIVTYSKIYQLSYNAAKNKVCGHVIFESRGMTKKGRFFAMDAGTVNNLVGFQLLNACT